MPHEKKSNKNSHPPAEAAAAASSTQAAAAAASSEAVEQDTLPPESPRSPAYDPMRSSASFFSMAATAASSEAAAATSRAPVRAADRPMGFSPEGDRIMGFPPSTPSTRAFMAMIERFPSRERDQLLLSYDGRFFFGQYEYNQDGMPLAFSGLEQLEEVAATAQLARQYGTLVKRRPFGQYTSSISPISSSSEEDNASEQSGPESP